MGNILDDDQNLVPFGQQQIEITAIKKTKRIWVIIAIISILINIGLLYYVFSPRPHIDDRAKYKIDSLNRVARLQIDSISLLNKSIELIRQRIAIGDAMKATNNAKIKQNTDAYTIKVAAIDTMGVSALSKFFTDRYR